MTRLGVGIIAFDRPQYLRRVIAGLEMQDYAGAVDYHLFLDGAVNAYSGRTVGNQGGIDMSARFFLKSHLTNKGIARQDANLGIGLHQVKAVDWMVQHYDRVMMLEDDAVISPHWIRLAMGLVDKYEGDAGIFGFSPSFRRQGKRLDVLLYRDCHWLCETFTARAWRQMRPHYEDYLDIIRGVDYKQRDHDAIKALYARNGWVHPATSQDAAKDMAIHKAKMRRVCCEVNRAINIGRQGVHLSPKLYERLGFSHQTPYIFDEDRTRTRFDEPIAA